MDDSLTPQSLMYTTTPGTSIGKDDDEPVDALKDMKTLFQILLKNRIPGPRLIRLTSEFTTEVGHGGEGIVYAASQIFEDRASAMDRNKDPRLRRSLHSWRACVVKRLRSDDARPYSYADQVGIAYSEIRRLCDDSFRHHKNIVKLTGWGIDLDALEDRSKSMSLLPLLILEKAQKDLHQFIKSSDYDYVSFDDLCTIARHIGRGLGAVHEANIAHGDMKPANVLMFSHIEGGRVTWVAKLCDFGSAAIEAKGGKKPTFRIRGTRNFWAPEYWIAENSVGSCSPESLRACDIFSFGLIVWNLFSGMPFPPLGIEESKEIALSKLGQQVYYGRASKCIRGQYETERFKNIVFMFEPMIFPHTISDGFVSLMVQRQKHHRKRRHQLTRNNIKVLEDEVNRILIVLRACLNDDAGARELSPWRYFNRRYFPSIPPVVDPVPFRPSDQNFTTDVIGDMSMRSSFKLTIDILSVHFSYLGTSIADSLTKHGSKTFSGNIGDWRRNASHNLKTWVPALKPGSTRQRLLESVYSQVRLDTPVWWHLNSLDVLDHRAEEACYPFVRFGGILRAFQIGYDDTVTSTKKLSKSRHMIYAIARIRSRIRSCCWANAKFQDLFTIASLTKNQWAWHHIDIATLAWLCRGEVGRIDLQDNIAELKWPFAPHLTLDPQLDKGKENREIVVTYEVLLLLELGCNLQSTNKFVYPSFSFLHQSSMTMFLRYLLSLQDQSLAIAVCKHFRRIAAEETTPPWTITFMTGQPADLLEDDESSPRPHFGLTTALHDSVRASNYLLVEYLVLTDFVVEALDGNRETALDLALGLERLKSARKPSNNKQIIALLQQRRGTMSEPAATKPDLPLGWEPCFDLNLEGIRQAGQKASQWVASSHGQQAWRETSIESDHDAITFRRPKAGLWEDQRIAFGQRKVTDSKGLVYHLDPLRFLRSRTDQEHKPKMATEPHYCDQWYIEDMKNTLQPPEDPLLDERAWYRNTARAWYALRSTRVAITPNVLSIFVPFSILSRALAWTKEIQITFHILSFIFMTTGIPQTKIFYRGRRSAIFNQKISDTKFANVSLICIPDTIVSFQP